MDPVSVSVVVSAPAERIFDLLDQPVTLSDETQAQMLPLVQGTLRFEHVDFSYDGHTQVLHDVSFEAEVTRFGNEAREDHLPARTG